MPAKIPESLKSGVIQQWLKGVERDKIAFGHSALVHGAVTNISQRVETNYRFSSS